MVGFLTVAVSRGSYTDDLTMVAGMVGEMREPSFLVLTALADGPRHGYGVIAEVADMTGGRVRLRPGTLYAALDRLSADGYVAVAGEEVVDGRLRRYHALTGPGAEALAVEAGRLRERAEQATRRLRAARARAVTA